jgi:hypothetical protein
MQLQISEVNLRAKRPKEAGPVIEKKYFLEQKFGNRNVFLFSLKFIK